MKQTFTKESIRIVQGEAYLFKGNNTIASTAPDAATMGFIQLDRKAFVKPVDVDELANQFTEGIELGKPVLKLSYVAGYKANPNEFTREEMIEAVKYGAAYAVSRKISSVQQLENDAVAYIDSIRPLSIPASVTIENNQVIEILW